MHATSRGIQYDVALGRQDNESSSSAIILLRQRDRRCVWSCNDDCLFLRLVHDLDAVPTLGHDSLHLVLRNVTAIEIVTRRILHSVPETTENNRTFRVSIFKSDSDFIANLRHEHEAAIRSSVRRSGAGPVSGAVILPEKLYLDSAHLLGIIVVHHSGRNKAVPRAGRRRPRITIVLPGCANEAVAVALRRPLMDYFYQPVHAFGVQRSIHLDRIARH